MADEPFPPQAVRGGPLLLDTNILVHAWNEASPNYERAIRLRDTAANAQIQACVCPQVLFEFLAVITDPRRIKRPISPRQAAEEVRAYEESQEIGKIYPTMTTVRTVLRLIEKYRIARQAVFDAVIVATMLDNDVRTICTENERDFAEYEEISVFNPFRAV